ncbi:MAG: cell division protein ZapD [Gammaproteobacteria bacterium]|nr:cell division protein ZapD [Gammaproteobacteria bacterium]
MTDVKTVVNETNVNSINSSTIYELPLNERIRTLLRLEFLFQQARYSMRGYSVWDSRATITHILDIMNIMSRIDLRSELLKELERQTSALLAISNRQGVDSSILDETLKNLETYTNNLRTSPSHAGHDLNNIELLKLIRQRDSIPGGSCDFDIPIYHFWLKQQPEQRIEILESWLAQLDTQRLAIGLILNLLRESAINNPIVAEQGFYQQSLDTSIPFQLIRVIVPSEAEYYAEMSGGKHRFSVRFMNPVDGERPGTSTEDIPFQLSCCAL